MQKKSNPSQPYLPEKIVYRLFDPKVGKYVSNIQESWQLGKSKLLYSNTTKSVILSENDLVKHYKKVHGLKARYAQLVIDEQNQKNGIMPRGRSYNYDKKALKREIKEIKALLKQINGLKLQQFKLTEQDDTEKKNTFKTRCSARMIKAIVKQNAENKYGWSIAEWLLKDSKKAVAGTRPYAIVEFLARSYNDNEQMEIAKTLKSVGIPTKWFSRYASQVEISCVEDYHLLSLSIDGDKIRRKFIVSELIEEYKQLQESVTESAQNKW